jgi:hypothetical protein
MNHSDVFENLVKIAKQEGLMGFDKEPKEWPEHTEKDFHETNVRMDSLSIEQIAKLYDNKPNAPKDMEYKRNIMELAHPKPLVLCPAYDNLNGLVENENEGQDIRIHISLRPPDGQLTQHKYAEQQFLLSLIRVGNKLDSQNKEKLRVLADTCLMQTTKIIKQG